MSISQNAPPCQVNFHFPEELIRLPRWLCWRLETRNGKPTKVPVSPATGGLAAVNRPETWGTYDQAVIYLKTHPDLGLGFVLEDLVGIDLDDAVGEDGTLEPWAAEIVSRFSSYAEISPSGRGVHILCKATLPPTGRRRRGHIEVYGGGVSHRYLTMTGMHLEETPFSIEERQAAVDWLLTQPELKTQTKEPESARDDEILLQKARNAANGPVFAALFDRGDWQAAYPSQSEADLALCSMLAFWTGGDPARIDRLFRRSALMRLKWDERHSADGRTYGQMTIDQAVSGTTETYHPRREWAGGVGHQESESGGEGGGDRPTKRPVALAVRLVDLVQREVLELFIDPREETYASLPVPGGGRACYPIRSTPFRRWLASRAMKEFGRCSAEALSEAVLALDALAAAGPRQEVFLRIAHQQGRVFVDLGDETWQAVEVTAAGWRIVSDSPVRFVRGKGMLPLPRPEGDPRQAWDLLRQFVNVPDESWPLLLGFLAGCWGPGPYPILGIGGEQGVGKSTLSRILKSLVDPNAAGIRREPREDRDVCISAAHQHLLAFDNLSGIPVWLSDLFSAITSGAGYSKRTLYTDSDETLLAVQRPIIVNGIGDLIHRSDLLDRAILLTLDPIPENRRRPEAEFWKAFEAARPTILAGMCEAVSCALRRRDSLRLESLPRLADFSTWVAAAEPALGLPEGSFLAAYRQNRQEAHVLALEGNATAEAVIRFMADRGGGWEGTAAELLRALFPPAEAWTQPKDAPTNARTLASTLRRLAPNLRAAQGIEVWFGRSKTRRTITLRVTQGDARVTQNPEVLRHPQNTDQERGGEIQTPLGDAGDADFCILSPRYGVKRQESGERAPEDKGKFASPASPPPVEGSQTRMNTELERVTQNQEVCVTLASPDPVLRHPTYDNTPGSSESLLRQAAALGWPAVALGPGKGIVGPGSEPWERFAAQAPPEDLDRAASALAELADPFGG